MDLFQPIDNPNLLPYDGEVVYHSRILDVAQCQKFFQALQDEIDWKQDEVTMFGKKHITARKVGWYGEKPFTYTYSNSQKVAQPWTPALITLKQLVEKQSQESFNSCLLNLYHTGNEGMGWHSDDEKELLPEGAIASVSLGVTRKFVFKHKQSKEKVSLMLENGSLLIMKGTTQKHWLHSLPKTKAIHRPRINLTFRTFMG